MTIFCIFIFIVIRLTKSLYIVTSCIWSIIYITFNNL
nr:MAG TPA: hypothetical protein [Caudoviricetes sp.]